MMGPNIWSAALRTNLRTEFMRPLTAVCWALALAMAVATGGMDPRGTLAGAVLAGPAVSIVQGHLMEGPNWTWLALSVLYLVSIMGLVAVDHAWLGLMLVRGLSRREWIMARLASLAVGAGTFVVSLVATLGIVALVGSAPLLHWNMVWNLGLWVLGLMSLGWFALALNLITRSEWPGWAFPLLLLALARYGGSLAPSIPFAQWIVQLHHRPGTLSVGWGAAYVGVWTALSGGVALCAARFRLTS